MNGFYNKVLHVNLSRRSFEEESIEDTVYQQFLGGKGLGTYLLLKNNQAGADPLSPDNTIIFTTGPVTDTRVFGSSRYGVFTKSPQTGYYCESYSGGKVAEPLSRTGYDAIVIKGASDSPVYLEVTNGQVIFRDAQYLWGKDTYQTEDAIREAIGRKDAGIVVIGPAGENLVRFAVIENNYWRSAGRGGPGTVLGSKKVKGIVFYGDAKRSVASPNMIKSLWEDTGSKAKTDPGVAAYKELGTPMMVAIMNKVGAFPTKYWSSGTYDKWEKISADALLSRVRNMKRSMFLAVSV